MHRRTTTIDLNSIALRSAVEQDVVEILTPVLQRPAHGEQDIRESDVFALRQFMGWHRLRFGNRPSASEIPEKLARFVHESGRPPEVGDGDHGREEIDQQLIAAGLRRERGVLSVVTLRRRVASIARVFEAAGTVRLRDNDAIATAIALLDADNRRDGQVTAIATSPCVRTGLLATCDATVGGMRDRALLAAWLATGASFSFLLRSDLQPLADAIHRCGDQALREMAIDALTLWSSVSALSTRPLFRRVRPDGRLGAPMSRTAVLQMVSRRLSLVLPTREC